MAGGATAKVSNDGNEHEDEHSEASEPHTSKGTLEQTMFYRITKSLAQMKRSMKALSESVRDKDDAITEVSIQTHVPTIERHYLNFMEAYSELIHCNLSEESLAKVEEKFSDVTKLIVAVTNLVGIDLDLTPVARTKKDTQVTSLKLPPLQIPVFEGDYKLFPQFLQIFEAIIDKNESLSNIQKLLFLRTNLKGEPFELIKAIEPLGENYESTKKVLKDRYHKPRVHKQELMAKLIAHPKPAPTNYKEHRNTIIFLKNIIAQLENAYPDISKEATVISLVFEKMPSYVKREWWSKIEWENFSTELGKFQFAPPPEDGIGGTAKELLTFWDQSLSKFEDSKSEFLPTKKHTKPKETRYVATSGSASSTGAKPRRQNSRVSNPKKLNDTKEKKKPFLGQGASAPGAKTHTANGEKGNRCLFCNMEHETYNCTTLMDVDTRYRILRDHPRSVCFGCLKEGHFLKDCYKPRKCNLKGCTKNHNPLLHKDIVNTRKSNRKK